MTEYFQYGEKELSYLKQRDKRLSEIIDKVGWVKRRVIPNLFAALVHSIVGQQISTKAHETIKKKPDKRMIFTIHLIRHYNYHYNTLR